MPFSCVIYEELFCSLKLFPITRNLQHASTTYKLVNYSYWVQLSRTEMIFMENNSDSYNTITVFHLNRYSFIMTITGVIINGIQYTFLFSGFGNRCLQPEKKCNYLFLNKTHSVKYNPILLPQFVYIQADGYVVKLMKPYTRLSLYVLSDTDF